MRALRRRQHDEEEESAFVSMTDMTVSFLFIVMILLAFFASQMQDKDMVSRKEYELLQKDRDKLKAELERLKSNPIQKYLGAIAEQRRRILENLEAKLRTDFPDLQVEISKEKDALRFKGDGLFPTGSSELRPDKRRIVESIATRLGEVLPCYTLGRLSSWSNACNVAVAAIEAVQIEGHTDSDGPDNNNITLSTNRANETFFAMLKREPSLLDHLNNRKQPVLSVAGYGKMRPVTSVNTPEGKAMNRRIDLRIIMYTPQSLEDIQNVQKDLSKGVAGVRPR